MNINLGVKKLTDTATIPQYAHEGDMCFDLYADSVTLKHREDVPCVEIGTGLAFEIPEGWGMKVYSRSGHGFKNHITLANGTGIIDQSYKGELKVKLKAEGAEGARFLNCLKRGDRIAQAMLVPCPKVSFHVIDELSLSERGDNGIGSTGTNETH